jgi:hypothetical protein
MKYIKTKFEKYFEELDFSRKNIDFTIVDSSDGFVDYLFEVDDITYDVGFDKEFDNFWTRSYENSEHTELDHSQSNKNPLKIVSAVTNVTEDFIKKYNPDAIIIYHVKMKNEKCPVDKLNKRAKINYYYLKDIKGYNLVYYNQLGITGEVKTTNCILYKKGVDISPITEKQWKRKPTLASMFWDNCKLVIP